MEDRALTFLDQTGDTTIVWDSSSDDHILNMIRQKMEEGFVFYIVKTIPIIGVSRLTKAKNLKEIKKAGGITIRDQQLEKLFLEGQIGITKTPSTNLNTVKKATDAREVASSQSVAIRPVRGG